MSDLLQNKYKTWYDNIVVKAKDRNSGDELHHIIPKSLGGLDTKENLVLLTHKEHFICHLLLIKFTQGIAKRKMSFALWRMKNNKAGKYLPNAQIVSIAKKAFSESIRQQHKGRIVTWSDKMKGKRPHVNQTGINNNNSKGTYVTPWGSFDSLKEATAAAPFKIDMSTLSRYCVQSNTKRYTGNQTKQWLLNKTPQECGFSFIEKT